MGIFLDPRGMTDYNFRDPDETEDNPDFNEEVEEEDDRENE
jgi:hypothetical protein